MYVTNLFLQRRSKVKVLITMSKCFGMVGNILKQGRHMQRAFIGSRLVSNVTLPSVQKL